MQWSRFNRLFRLEKTGGFLYNALSNTLFELDESHYTILEDWQNGRSYDANGDEYFLSVLSKKTVLVRSGEEEQHLLACRYQRQVTCFDSSVLCLTICPTLRCNFQCPYCFEQSQQDGAIMTPETIDRLISFIRRYKDIRHLFVSWYGGEPLLAFDTIYTLTRQFKTLDLNFEGAGMITNGYLLDKERIARLNDLRIRSIQITLDGPRETHDSWRVLRSGGSTFERILNNVTALFQSPYKGKCIIRVNIDKNNRGAFIELQAALLNRFKGKNLIIYPGYVQTSRSHPYAHTDTLDIKEWTDFTFDLFWREGLVPSGGFYPPFGNQDAGCNSICAATKHNEFVIGPEGELYKCWEDVGRPDMVIGNIHLDEPIENDLMRAQYTLGTDAFCDPECLACDVLPICGGGCANKRMRTKRYGEKGLAFCSPFKEHLIRYLEAYICTFWTKELCASILNSGEIKPEDTGYRIISPGCVPQ